MSKLDDILSMHLHEIKAGHDGKLKQSIKHLMLELIDKNEVYEELEYPRVDEEGEPLWSKNAIKESRKQRMARVVQRNELRAELRQKVEEL